MKKVRSMAVALVFLLMQVAPVLAAAPMEASPLPLRMSGKIMNEDAHSILVQTYKGDQQVILNISDDTYIADAVTGSPLMLKDRVGDDVVAYYGPIETKSMPAKSNAVAIICSIPQDFGAPFYAKAEAVESTAKGIKVTTDGGDMIVTLNSDTPLSPFKTKNIVALGNIGVGTDLLLWYGPAALSYPAQATATKAVILSPNEPAVSGTAAPATTTPSTVAPDTSFTVTDKPLPEDGGIVKGNLPVFTSTTNQPFYDKLNEQVSKICEEALKTATADQSTEVYFSYDTATFDHYTSVMLHTSISAGNTGSDVVNTFVLDNKTDKQYTLVDILGPNAYKIANDYIHDQMVAAPEGASYFTDESAFRGIKSEPNFYVDANGNAVIIFDKYSIAPGVMGTPTFAIPIASIINQEVPTAQTYMKEDIRMVPLAVVAQAYGYSVTWNGANKTITLTKGDQTQILSIGKNMYGKDEREFAPEIGKDQRTYVPISYFEVVLHGCYVVDDATITFSK